MTIFVCTGNKGKLAEFEAAFGGIPVIGLREVEARCGVPFEEPAEEEDLFLANGLTKLAHAVSWLSRSAAAAGLDPRDLASRVLVDDSGLCVPALGLAPGVHSATYGGLPRDDARNRAALRAELEREGLDEAAAFFVCYLLSVETRGIGAPSGTPSGTPAGTPAGTAGPVATDSAAVRALEREVHMPLATRACARGEPMGSAAIRRAWSALVPGEIVSTRGALEVDIAFGFCTGETRTIEQNLVPGAGHGYDSLFYPTAFPDLSFASVAMEAKNAVSHRATALRAFLGAIGSAP